MDGVEQPVTPPVDIRQIQYFICLYEEGNVTRAARRLNVVQSALSMQIAKIESELGHKLFDRTPQGMLPTFAGRTLFGLYQPILRDIATARQVMSQLGDEVGGELRIGLPESVTRSILPSTLAEYAARYPHVSLRITGGYSSTFIEDVTTGRLDLAIINRPRHRLTVDETPILSEDLVLVQAANGAPGMALPRRLRLKYLAAHPLILPSQRHSLRTIIDQHALAEGVELTPRLEIDDLDAIAEVVAGGGWLSLLPRIVAQRAGHEGALMPQRLDGPPLERTLSWIQAPRRPLSPAARKFMELLGRRLIDQGAQASRRAGPGDEAPSPTSPD